MTENDLGWRIDERFLPDQLGVIATAATRLLEGFQQLGLGDGRKWIKQNTQGTSIHRGGLPASLAKCVTGEPTSIVVPLRDIWLAKGFEQFPHPDQHILHELGHVIDNHSSRSTRLPATILGGGVADRLISRLGGKPAGLRFCNHLGGVPRRFWWRGRGSYGNHSSADYFAEAFAWLWCDVNRLPDPLVGDGLIELLFRDEHWG